jgi:hypothetical protein
MIEVHAPIGDKQPPICSGCGGTKEAPIATILSVYYQSLGVTILLCAVRARDLANAVGFMWSRASTARASSSSNMSVNQPLKGRG